MSINLIRVVNQQTIRRSILLDKLDDGQANTEGYAYKHLKQQVYVPFANPLNPVVKGYTDLVPTDRVLLSVDRGTIKGLVDAGKVLAFVYSSALKAAPIITAVAHVGTDTTIDGTTFLSVTPDITYVIINNGVTTQKIPSSAFSVHTAVQIVIPDAAITIGVPAETWTVTVEANCQNSNVRPIRATPVISSALVNVPGAGDLTIAGTGFVSIVPTNTSATITGTGAIVLDQATITGGGGTVTDTAIVIPAALFTNGAIAAVTSSVKVTADFLDSGVVVVA